MTIDALRAGLRVVEVPTQLSHRVTGRSWGGFRHRGRQFAHVARALSPRLRHGRTPSSFPGVAGQGLPGPGTG